MVNVVGTVESIRFRNEDNGYTVFLLLDESKNDIMCVATMVSISEGEMLSINGEIVYHKKYGEQLVVDSYTTVMPTSRDGILRYLGSGLIKGVGEKTAENIYKMFGDDTLNVIETNPSALAKVKGISAAKAQIIGSSVMERKVAQKYIMFLQQYGITAKLAHKIYSLYKSETINFVSDNPYRLIDDIDGVGFITADKIARSMGHAIDGEFRIRAGLLYTLMDNAEKKGNTYIVKEVLLAEAGKLLSLDLSQYSVTCEMVLTKLVLQPLIKIFQLDDSEVVCLNKYYSLEHSVANKLISLSLPRHNLDADIDGMISDFEENNDIHFHISQLMAVKNSVTGGVSVITGGPGTGKTTIIKCIADILSRLGKSIEFCAPTGRASKRLAVSTGYDAKTIHRLLVVDFGERGMNFVYNQRNPLNCDVLIVDEVSMVDISIMHYLLRAVKEGSQVILVGDKDQLPSVGAGNVLSDIIKSDTIYINYLTHIYRQSNDSLIVSNAHLINNGKMPIIDNKSCDFFVSNESDMASVLDTVVGMVSRRLPAFTGDKASNIQVLGALKSGVAGIENTNKVLQNTINPPSSDKPEVTVGNNIFRLGDKVMHIVNNYELMYVRRLANGSIEEGKGVFNGDIGYIIRVDKANSELVIQLDDDRVATYDSSCFDQLILAYAITIHKSQGSEFETVVIPLLSGPPTVINRNLLYTAITRAKKLVVLVGSNKVLSMMVHNDYIAQRNTMLCRFLCDAKHTHNVFMGEANG